MMRQRTAGTTVALNFCRPKRRYLHAGAIQGRQTRLEGTTSSSSLSLLSFSFGSTTPYHQKTIWTRTRLQCHYSVLTEQRHCSGGWVGQIRGLASESSANVNRKTNVENENHERKNDVAEEEEEDISETNEDGSPRARLKQIPRNWVGRPMAFLELSTKKRRDDEEDEVDGKKDTGTSSSSSSSSSIQCLPLWKAEYCGEEFIIGKPVHPPVALYWYPLPDGSQPLQDEPTPTYMDPTSDEMTSIVDVVQDRLLQAVGHVAPNVALQRTRQTLRLVGLSSYDDHEHMGDPEEGKIFQYYKGAGSYQRLVEFGAQHRVTTERRVYLLVKPMFPVLHIAKLSRMPMPMEDDEKANGDNTATESKPKKRTRVYGRIRSNNTNDTNMSTVLQLLTLDECEEVIPRLQHNALTEEPLLQDEVFQKHGETQFLYRSMNMALDEQARLQQQAPHGPTQLEAGDGEKDKLK